MGEATISWSQNGQKVCYVITTSRASDFIYIGDYNSPNDSGYEVTSIGAYQPAISNDLSQVVFAARDGNIWIRNLVDTNKRYLQLTTSGKVSTSLYPMWSNEGDKILFVKQFKDEEDIMKRSLEIIDIRRQEQESKVLSNNVFRGFWNRSK
jgi:Tol biopolymer transport system component